MKKHNPTPNKRLSQQALELSIAAPQVVARRMAQMALAGPNPSAKDQKEFKQMSNEKVTAFYQSWSAMWAQMFKSQFAIAQAITASVSTAMMGGRPLDASRTINAFTQETNKIISAGMDPVHRTAVSNARRLSRSK
jgi:hypothetical protein